LSQTRTQSQRLLRRGAQAELSEPLNRTASRRADCCRKLVCSAAPRSSPVSRLPSCPSIGWRALHVSTARHLLGHAGEGMRILRGIADAIEHPANCPSR